MENNGSDLVETPSPRLAESYALSTPYGVVTIAHNGRVVTFELYSDVRQSMHNSALYGYVQKLRQSGVTRWNSDHLHLHGRDRTLDLNRGKVRLDLIYERRGKLIECELKTRRELGLDTTAKQLAEFLKHCERLHLLVPRGSLEEADTILTMLYIKDKITVEPYDTSLEDDDV